VVNGKVSHVTAKHRTKGHLPVRKFITRKGKQQVSTATDNPNLVPFVADDEETNLTRAQVGGCTCYVVSQFYCQTSQVIIIYWLPVYQVQSTAGCTPYPYNDGPFGDNFDNSGGNGGDGKRLVISGRCG
jgi:hypothetical protein